MGSKSDTDRAFADLNHALDALGDGAGNDTWGPGAILSRMGGKSPYAASAFDYAAVVTYNMLGSRTPERFIREMRVLAPVLLQLILDGEEGDADDLAALFKSVTIGPEG